MKSLLKQIAVLRIINYCNAFISIGVTVVMIFDGYPLVLLLAALSCGLLVAALAINQITIELKNRDTKI